MDQREGPAEDENSEVYMTDEEDEGLYQPHGDLHLSSASRGASKHETKWGMYDEDSFVKEFFPGGPYNPPMHAVLHQAPKHTFAKDDRQQYLGTANRAGLLSPGPIYNPIPEKLLRGSTPNVSSFKATERRMDADGRMGDFPQFSNDPRRCSPPCTTYYANYDTVMEVEPKFTIPRDDREQYLGNQKALGLGPGPIYNPAYGSIEHRTRAPIISVERRNHPMHNPLYDGGRGRTTTPGPARYKPKLDAARQNNQTGGSFSRAPRFGPGSTTVSYVTTEGPAGYRPSHKLAKRDHSSVGGRFSKINVGPNLSQRTKSPNKSRRAQDSRVAIRGLYLRPNTAPTPGVLLNPKRRPIS